MKNPTLIETEDGSNTLVHPVLGECYHSTRGAVGESMHVFIRNGFDFLQIRQLRIFEVGFGSGLNALLTLQQAAATSRQVEYHTVELYPIDPDFAATLNYTAADSEDRKIFEKIHTSPWDELTVITNEFSLKKFEVSLLDFEPEGLFDLIYFDAFAYESQPELWSENIFSKLFRHTAPGGVLVTYSAKGEVKRNLRAADYEVHRIEGALGKRHMLRCIK